MPDLEDVLAELPDTADGIAALLIEQGCRGRRQDGHCCPMATYLVRREFAEPFVQPDFVAVASEWQATTPRALDDFIYRFDEGEWPELVADA